jgi:tRNA (cytidine/uridine-2'-O-)-methyltransferase
MSAPRLPEPAAPLPERHVVLVAPEVHWNTGNIGRTCLGVGARLHLVRPLGFSLEDRHVKRAGLDYWPRVPLTVWDSFEALCTALAPGEHEVALFSKAAPQSFRHLPAVGRLLLVFGSETRGLPQEIEGRFPARRFHIPIRSAIRSLNLSTAVGIALYESLRLAPDWHAWPPSVASS